MLTLDETTLFYYYRSQPKDSNKKVASIIKNWRKAVEIEPAARVNSLKTGGSGPSSVRGASTTLQKSATTNITSDRGVTAALEDEEPEEPENSNNDACGGLANEFELDGPEGEFATLSPFKGKKRVTNDVSYLFCLHCLH